MSASWSRYDSDLREQAASAIGGVMKAVRHVSGQAIPLGLKNVDTDMILPGRYLKTITRKGLGVAAFEPLRAQPGNIFDDPRFRGARIIIAGENFGCGSSREHAVWALTDFGIEAVIAPSFSDIFSGNAFKNGMVVVVLSQPAVNRLIEVAAAHPISIDLERQVVTTPLGDSFDFAIDSFRKHCLVNGLDEIGITLECSDAIAAFEQRIAESQPWHYVLW
jgi:3-isopropylmalate/(R)-2-methylmalate dehydratase small subunit